MMYKLNSLPTKKKPMGFTLPELILVLVIIALISVFAVPSYTDYVRKSYRSEAQTLITEIAMSLDTLLDTNGRLYVDKSDPYFNLQTDLGYRCIPENKDDCGSGKARFEIIIDYPTEETYTISLVARNGQVKDPCSKAGITLNSFNERTPTTAGNEDCWKK